jgi:OmpA-OmpF porin, OOP family
MKKILFCLIMVLVASFPSHHAIAQINLEKKATNATIRRADKRTDQGIDKGLDAAENGVKSLFSKKNKNENKKEPEKTDQKSEKKAETKEPTSNPEQDPGLTSYSKFDFIPGETVIFFDDFSQDAVGDFPALWNTNGSAEVVTTNLFPGRWMRFICREAIWTDALLKLPENYTIEYDIIPINGKENRMVGYSMRLMQSINAKSWDSGTVPGKAGFDFSMEYYGRPDYKTYINGKEGQGLGLSGVCNDEISKQKVNQKYHISIWMQKSRIRFYQNETKLFDLPKAFPTEIVKMDRIRFEYGAAMVSNVRIAIGAPDMRNKLLTEGKLVTYGIYFDVNSDKVKPESYGTLKSIADVLKENVDLRVKIFGHTDGDGDAEKNLDLSKRRAASVKTELSKTFGIDAAHIETDGKGKTEPIAPNDTPANKAKNRRVEFIKL